MSCQEIPLNLVIVLIMKIKNEKRSPKYYKKLFQFNKKRNLGIL